MKATIIKLGIVAALATGFTACSGGMVITSRPEAPYYERPISPGPGYVWVDGDWYWTGGRYVYHNGYWARPRGTRVWVTGSWEQRGNGWRWRRGHWR
ncbi:MAG: YXWGXW repeat-containing protein [Bacteroidetes bacterium]|nr:YXWGXW repeat-containing protein [Bacteroidota bacterium]